MSIPNRANNPKRKPQIDERYLVVHKGRGLTAATTNKGEAERGAYINPPSTVANVSTYRNPSIMQRLTNASPGKAEAKAAKKEANIKEFHRVYDEKDKYVTTFPKGQAQEARKAAPIGGRVVSQTIDRNRPIIPRTKTKTWTNK